MSRRKLQFRSRLRAMAGWRKDYGTALRAAENELELRAQEDGLFFPPKKDPMRMILADSYLKAQFAKEQEEERNAKEKFSFLFRTLMVGFLKEIAFERPAPTQA